MNLLHTQLQKQPYIDGKMEAMHPIQLKYYASCRLPLHTHTHARTHALNMKCACECLPMSCIRVAGYKLADKFLPKSRDGALLRSYLDTKRSQAPPMLIFRKLFELY